MIPDPSFVAKWLLLVFAGGLLSFDLRGADEPERIIAAVVLSLWFVAPTALAAFLTAGAHSGWVAWLFLTAEATAATTTVWCWIDLYAHPDAQNGIAMVLFPLVQFAALTTCGAMVFGARWIRRK